MTDETAENDEWELPPEPMRFEPNFYCDSCHRGKVDTVLIGKVEPENRFMFLCLDCLQAAIRVLRAGARKPDSHDLTAADFVKWFIDN